MNQGSKNSNWNCLLRVAEKRDVISALFLKNYLSEASIKPLLYSATLGFASCVIISYILAWLQLVQCTFICSQWNNYILKWAACDVKVAANDIIYYGS